MEYEGGGKRLLGLVAGEIKTEGDEGSNLLTPTYLLRELEYLFYY